MLTGDLSADKGRGCYQAVPVSFPHPMSRKALCDHQTLWFMISFYSGDRMRLEDALTHRVRLVLQDSGQDRVHLGLCNTPFTDVALDIALMMALPSELQALSGLGHAWPLWGLGW